ncbi:hypothetical protein GTP81_13660 [Rugamonas sp. FT107W]|uniref:Uncharacterized protein n=1 Tax=Duganella vulcania TaxID=2692166 RepID=A0A845HLN6_9BURK|nr:hypothetical protein [Duganella vulcania]
MAIRALAVALIVAISGIFFHYYIRLRVLEHTPLVVIPGKWVWVECRTLPFAAIIEEVRVSGIMVSVVAPLPTELRCDELGITAQGDNKYFLPIRTVLGLQIDDHRVWFNPYSM